jgi:uncharacterized protein (TIGR03437 family)
MNKPAVVGVTVLTTVAAWASISEMTSAGIPLFRPDSPAIQVLLNTSFQAGATNADGHTVVTSGSNPMQALTAATAQWNRIPSALINFLPVQSTTVPNQNDGKFVVTIQDTPANRSALGSALAITSYWYYDDGTISDSDILFNPNLTIGGVLYPFSTDHSLGSFDLQSVLAHELGHSLGATHTPVIGATMFQSQSAFLSYISVAEATLHQALSADDVSFATTRYPAPTAAAQFGSIAGKVAFSTGAVVAGALVVAVDAAAGTTIGGLASTRDGTYRLDGVRPGSYLVYAQPANGPMMAANLTGVPNTSQVNTFFRATFAGGNTAPNAVPVTAGQASTANISVDPASPGMQVAYLGTGSAGGSDWASVNGPKASPAGSPVDLLLWGNGLDSTVTQSQIRLIGPGISLRAGTLHTPPNSTVGGYAPLRFTVDLAPLATGANPVTIAVVKGTDAAVYSGGFVIVGAASGCTYTLSSKQFSVPAGGGQGTVAVTAGTGCAWTAASGASWLKIASTTAASGNGSVFFAADPNASAIVRSASLTVAGQTVIVSQAGASSGATPVISSVLNGASFQAGIESGSWVTITGTNLANTNPGRTWRTDEIVEGKLPATLDGVSVTIDGRTAFVEYISPTQINVQAPTDGSTGAVSVVVTNNGAVSAAGTAQLQVFAPACFQYSSSGTLYAIATRYPDNTLVGNPATTPGTVAAAPGDVLILWATGFGPTNPATAAGTVVAGAPAVATLPSVTVGGTPVTVIGGALSQGFEGLYQIAIQLPASVPVGLSAIRASVGGYTSPAGVNLFVQ